VQTASKVNWRECEFVTPAVAAKILGYSVSTIRNLLFNDGLRAVRLARSGPVFVTVKSLIEFIDGAQPVSKDELARIVRTKHPTPFFLIQGGRK
jgi:hypothetical protein